MVSHVDDDHIQGILDLTKELIGAEMDHKPRLVLIDGLWHNGFEDIVDREPEERTADLKQQFCAASMDGDWPDDSALEADDELGEAAVCSSLKVLSSIEQGARLRSDADRLAIEWNRKFDDRRIVADDAGESIDMGDGLSFTVLGPAEPELTALRKKHQEWLARLKKKGMTPAEALAAYVDDSVTNLSSLVVLAEVDGRRILLTGDARGDKILEGLERAGLMAAGGTIHVDVLKVPHQGSANNLDDDFFERITADHYVFSGDGEHGNPERQALRMLLDARGESKYTVHLTYPVAEIDAARRDGWEKERAKQKLRQAKNPKLKVRPEWSPEEHSLSALLAAHPRFADKIRVLAEGRPHLIDLLSEVGA
jgi:hypothetical protein